MTSADTEDAVRSLRSAGWSRLAAAVALAPHSALARALPAFWVTVMLFPVETFPERLHRELARRALERLALAAGVELAPARSEDLDSDAPSLPPGSLS